MDTVSTKHRISAYNCEFFPRFISFRTDRAYYRWIAIIWGWLGMHNFYYRHYRRGFTKLGIALFLLMAHAPGGMFVLLWLWGVTEILFIRRENLDVPTAGEQGHNLLSEIIVNSKNFPGEVVFEMGRQVVKKGAKINVKNRTGSGYYPIHYIIESYRIPGEVRIKMLHYFIEKGCDVTVQTASKYTALQKVLRNSCDDTSDTIVQLVKALLRAAEANGTDQCNAIVCNHHPQDKDDVPLWMVLNNTGHLTSEARVDIVGLLLMVGVDADELNNDQESPLQFLCCGKATLTSKATEKVGELLLTSGADSGQRDTEGNTCLHLAAMSGQTKLCACLLQKGADRTAKNNRGKTARDLTDNPFIRDMLSVH